MSTLPPLRRQVVVPSGPETAFEVFTDRIGAWWPVERHSVFGAGATAAFRDGRLVETGPDGGESVWGTVLEWDPPRLLSLTWHPGNAAERAGRVEVTFTPIADALTLVTVTHDGWERLRDPAATRAEYRNGWPSVLAGFATVVEPGAAPGDGPVWLVLSHTPAPGVVDPFVHPDFAGHLAFLASLAARDLLVAAGPFAGAGSSAGSAGGSSAASSGGSSAASAGGSSAASAGGSAGGSSGGPSAGSSAASSGGSFAGDGMTVLRLPDPADAAWIVAAATEQDTSVVNGVLEVWVRPWVVAMRGSSLA
jgi:uncharacterized protein YndB with AHSA1/START domain